MTPEESQIRQQFEALSDGVRNKKIGIAVNTASGIYTGFTVGGPIGAAIGGALGLLTGLWGLSGYRKRVYAELEQMGAIRKPRTRIRSIMARRLSDDPAFLRYPHGEVVGDAVMEVLTQTYRRMTHEEIVAKAYLVVKTFHEFRRSNPDIPIEIAAEVILLLNGIRRNEVTGDYEVFELDFPEEPPIDYRYPADTNGDQQANRSVNIAWGLAGAALIVYLWRGRQ